MTQKSRITLYHFCTPQQWEEQRDAKTYRPESLEQEGFIHLSTSQQLPKTFEQYFGSAEKVLLLRIQLPEQDEVLVFEDTYDKGEAFPHYYAALPLNAVQEILPVPEATPGGAPEHNRVLKTFFEQL